MLFGVVRRTFEAGRVSSGSPRGIDKGRATAANFALACALVWALHPLNTEVVNYLTERTESVMACFYLLTLYCAIRGWTTAAVAACALGMLSKESMVTAPVAVVLYDRIFRFESLREAFHARRTLYAGLAATWMVLAGVLLSTPRTSVGFETGTTPWIYLLNQAELVPRYLWLALWPRDLVLDYGLPRSLMLADVLLSGLLVIALIVATLAALWLRPMLGFLGAWVFLTLAPTSSFVPIATEVGAERRMYLPLMAIVVLIVAAMGRALSGPPGEADKPRATRFAVAVAMMCLALAAGTYARNQEYASRLSIAQTVVERRPHGRGHFLLGNELLSAGQRDAAMQQFRLSARDYPGARFALATELLGAGDAAAATPELQAFLAAMPAGHQTIAPARDLLARAYLAQRRFAEAADELRRLRADSPGYRGAGNDIGYNLGYALAASGRLAEAVPVLEGAVTANPGDTAARDLLTRIRAALAASALTNRGN
jgi:hypothetical protein